MSEEIKEKPEIQIEEFNNLLPGISVMTYGGYCPVQAEGLVDFLPFYFRSRGEHWSVEICLNQECPIDYSRWTNREKNVWKIRTRYSDEPYKAGAISPQEFVTFLNQAVSKFREEMGFKK